MKPVSTLLHDHYCLGLDHVNTVLLCLVSPSPVDNNVPVHLFDDLGSLICESHEKVSISCTSTDQSFTRWLRCVLTFNVNWTVSLHL